jgi:hypothetical protein
VAFGRDGALFGELGGQTFSSYGEFDDRVREIFARHRATFPTSRLGKCWSDGRLRGLAGVAGGQAAAVPPAAWRPVLPRRAVERRSALASRRRASAYSLGVASPRSMLCLAQRLGPVLVGGRLLLSARRGATEGCGSLVSYSHDPSSPTKVVRINGQRVARGRKPGLEKGKIYLRVHRSSDADT